MRFQGNRSDRGQVRAAEEIHLLKCRDIAEGASAYLDREVSWWRRLQFKLHLSMCQHCRRYVDQMEAVVRLLRTQPTEPPAPEALDAIVEQFRSQR
jgi:predicted anti-sigma-YlaC factor YlaD